MTYPHMIVSDGDEPVDLAWTTPAIQADADYVLNQPIEDDGRSEWTWIRFRDGTLALATFPCGDTYMEMSVKGVCDFGVPTDA